MDKDTHLILFASSGVFFVLGLFMFAYAPIAHTQIRGHLNSTMNAASAAEALPLPPSPVPLALAPKGAALSASSTQSADSVDSPKVTRYLYHLAYDVDLCTFNKLGKDGWVPLQYGTDAGNGSNLRLGYGRDENCANTKAYDNFVWVLFQKTYEIAQ